MHPVLEQGVPGAPVLLVVCHALLRFRGVPSRLKVLLHETLPHVQNVRRSIRCAQSRPSRTPDRGLADAFANSSVVAKSNTDFLLMAQLAAPRIARTRLPVRFGTTQRLGAPNRYPFRRSAFTNGAKAGGCGSSSLSDIAVVVSKPTS